MFFIILVVVLTMPLLGRYAWKRNRALGAVVYTITIAVIVWMIAMYFVLEKAGWMDH